MAERYTVTDASTGSIFYMGDSSRKAFATAVRIIQRERAEDLGGERVEVDPTAIFIQDALAGTRIFIRVIGDKVVKVFHQLHDEPEATQIEADVYSEGELSLLVALSEGRAGLPKDKVAALVQKREALTRRGTRDLRQAASSFGYDITEDVEMEVPFQFVDHFGE